MDWHGGDSTKFQCPVEVIARNVGFGVCHTELIRLTNSNMPDWYSAN